MVGKAVLGLPDDFFDTDQGQEVVKKQPVAVVSSNLFSLFVDLKLGGGLQVFLYFLLKYAKP